MNLDAFQTFSDQARVWVYQADRELDATELAWVNEELATFVKTWAAHGNKLHGNARMITPFALVFVVEEATTLPSGCSIDASVHFVKSLEKELNVDFFNRMYVWTKIDNTLQRLPVAELSEQNDSLMLFDPLIANLGSLRNSFLVALSKSSLSHVLQAG